MVPNQALRLVDSLRQALLGWVLQPALVTRAQAGLAGKEQEREVVL